MTKKKSILTLALAVCLIVPALCMLTACGANKNNTGKNDTEETATIKTETIITLDNAYVLTKTYDGQTAENPTETQITKNSDGAMTIEWYAGEIKLEEGPKDAGNYKLVISTAETDTYNAGKLEKDYTINKKQLTISGTTVADKEYDGNNTATVTAGALDGLVGIDELSVGVTAIGTFASKDVAYEYDVKQQDVTISYALTGNLAKNYLAPDGETQQAKINPKPLSNVNVAKDYDGSSEYRTKLTTEQGIVDGENIVIYIQTSSKNAGVYKDSDGTISDCIFYDSGKETSNYAWSNTCTATIEKLQLVVNATVANKTYDGTTNGSLKSLTSNVIEGDDLTITPTVTFANKLPAGNVPCSISYAISGDSAENYIAPEYEIKYNASISAYTFVDAKTGTSTDKIYVSARLVNNAGYVSFEDVVVTGDIFEGDTITATITRNGDSSKYGLTYYRSVDTYISSTNYTITFGGADADNYVFSYDLENGRYNPNVYLNIYEKKVEVDTETQCGAYASSTYWVKVDLTAVTGENRYSLVPKTEGTIATSGSNAPVMYDEEGNVVENMKPTKDGTYFIKFYANNANPYITVTSPEA